jgi:RNA polymerase sigma-70 factor (ECF subfamily)
LLTLHRDRLRRMIAVRMDPRVAGRLDPSDVIQETVMEAARRLPDYLRRRDCAFYPWLRRIAWDQLVAIHRRHVEARRRAVEREAWGELGLSDESVAQLADVFQARQASPSSHLLREELRQRVQAALAGLGGQDREVLVLRHLEQLSMQETAEVLGISLSAAQSRYRRALERLHERLGGKSLEDC